MANAEKIDRPSIPGRILVIDDDLPTLYLIQLLLEGEGLDVATAPNGSTGLIAYHEHHPDLILLNISMPDLDGIHVYRELRGLGYQGKVVFVTARPDTPAILLERQIEDADCLNKPLHPDHFVATVRSFLLRNDGGA